MFHASALSPSPLTRVPSPFPIQSPCTHAHPKDAYYLPCLSRAAVLAHHYLVTRVSAGATADGFHFCTQEHVVGVGRAGRAYSAPGALAQVASQLLPSPSLPSPSRASILLPYPGNSRSIVAEQ